MDRVFSHLLTPYLLALLLTSCITTGLTHVEFEPGFDWDTLKRDQILMSPLVDLRPNKKLAQSPAFFKDDELITYAESFKQVFFKLRKDIRVFGAGGAFEQISSMEQIPDLAQKIFTKEPLQNTEASALVSRMQDKRFLFFFAMTNESLDRDFYYDYRDDHEKDLLSYTSIRKMKIQMALWDSKTNKTVWIGTQDLKPTNTNEVEIANPSKVRVQTGDTVSWEGFPLHVSISEELRENPDRFPRFPGREPSFSRSFDDFVLGLPIHPSEEKLIEYEHFTSHRPEFALRTSQFGARKMTSLQLSTSSAIYYHYRLGGALVVPLNEASATFESKEIEISSSSFGIIFDYDWNLGERLRLLTGFMAGSTIFRMNEIIHPSAADDGSTKPGVETDATLHLWPRIMFLYGKKTGIQWGAGGSLRFYDGIEKPSLKAHRPSLWSLDLSVAYVFRGF